MNLETRPTNINRCDVLETELSDKKFNHMTPEIFRDFAHCWV